MLLRSSLPGRTHAPAERPEMHEPRGEGMDVGADVTGDNTLIQSLARILFIQYQVQFLPWTAHVT